MTKHNDFIQAELIAYFISLTEADFTKKVLKPIFEHMGYQPVDYYGGRDEGGKDLICWKKDEFDDKHVTVVQVKKTSPSAAAAKNNSFGGIITQLQQAKEQRVASLDGVERLPDSVYFITPYEIDTRALESRLEGYQTLRSRGVKVYDGTYIAEQIVKRLPHLLPSFLGQQYILNTSDNLELSNDSLLNSLSYKNDKDYKSFYINLDFGVGRINSALFLDWEFFPKAKSVKFSENEYSAVKERVKLFEDFFNISCVKPSWTEIEERRNFNFKEFDSEENEKNLKTLKRLQLELVQLVDGFADAISSIIDSHSLRFKVDIHGGIVDNAEQKIRENQTTLMVLLDSILSHKDIPSTKAFILENEERINQLLESTHRILINSIKPTASIKPSKVIIKKGSKTELQQIDALFLSVEQNLKKIKSTDKSIFEIMKVVISEPDYEFTLDCSEIAEQLIQKQFQLKNALLTFKNPDLHKAELRNLLIEFSELFEKLDILLHDKLISDALNPVPKIIDLKSIDELRNHVPIFDIFRTGINVAILGEAGAGKSTTLEMYARQANAENYKDKLTLYLPLTKIIDPYKKSDLQPLELLESGILKYLNQKKSSALTNDDFKKAIKHYQESTFIFDGVDEVVKSTPQILQAINSFSKEYKTSQIIISSRLGGNYLSEIKFLTVTVLPFTDEQLFDFINGWFSNEPGKIAPIRSHLISNPLVMDVVRNPLLATILCVLADNNIPLPTKEISLYKERTKLLFGHYDIHKKAIRVESHHELLEDVARKIAFKLHSSNKRMETKDRLTEMAIDALKLSSYTKLQIETAVNELATACNVIFEMSSNEEYGFGHLRFQEHLAAEEIVKNRGVEIPPLLTSPWWRSVMVLFAQMTDNLVSILDDQLQKHAGLGPATETIQAMVNVRTPEESKIIQTLIDKYKKIDEMENPDYWDSSELNYEPNSY